MLEKVNNMYKIYQSFVAKYTIKEWLNGKLTKDVLKDFELFKFLKESDEYKIGLAFNNDNNEFEKQFKQTVNNFGGPNCIPTEQVEKFLNLLSEMLIKIKNYTDSNKNTINQINDISKQIFGPKLFYEDDNYDYVGRAKLIGSNKPTVFIRVKSSETTCVDRISESIG